MAGVGRPRGPGLAAAFRAAAFDFYYQSIRLVPANLLWGLAFLAWLIVAVSTGPLVTLVTAPLLAVPWVGVVRLAALTARGRTSCCPTSGRRSGGSGSSRWRSGRSSALAVAILASNAFLGANLGGPVGWALTTLSLTGLVALWVLSWPFWVLLVDPEHEDRPLRSRARLAALLVVARAGPARVAVARAGAAAARQHGCVRRGPDDRAGLRGARLGPLLPAARGPARALARAARRGRATAGADAGRPPREVVRARPTRPPRAGVASPT